MIDRDPLLIALKWYKVGVLFAPNFCEKRNAKNGRFLRMGMNSLYYNATIDSEVEMPTSKVIFSPISRQNVSHFQSQQRLM